MNEEIIAVALMQNNNLLCTKCSTFSMHVYLFLNLSTKAQGIQPIYILECEENQLRG